MGLAEDLALGIYLPPLSLCRDSDDHHHTQLLYIDTEDLTETFMLARHTNHQQWQAPGQGEALLQQPRQAVPEEGHLRLSAGRHIRLSAYAHTPEHTHTSTRSICTYKFYKKIVFLAIKIKNISFIKSFIHKIIK